MQQVPLQAVPSQTVNVLLGNQNTFITLRQLSTGLYMNVAVGLTQIVGLVLCEDYNPIVRDAYLGFAGDLVFVDFTTLGFDPVFTGLEDRFGLFYIEASEIPSSAR